MPRLCLVCMVIRLHKLVCASCEAPVERRSLVGESTVIFARSSAWTDLQVYCIACYESSLFSKACARPRAGCAVRTRFHVSGTGLRARLDLLRGGVSLRKQTRHASGRRRPSVASSRSPGVQSDHTQFSAYIVQLPACAFERFRRTGQALPPFRHLSSSRQKRSVGLA